MIRRIAKLLSGHKPQETPVGKYATVTTYGAIQTNNIGEVRMSLWGGTEYFYAKSTPDTKGVIQADEEVVVVDYHPPRTVTVARATD